MWLQLCFRIGCLWLCHQINTNWSRTKIFSWSSTLNVGIIFENIWVHIILLLFINLDRSFWFPTVLPWCRRGLANKHLYSLQFIFILIWTWALLDQVKYPAWCEAVSFPIPIILCTFTYCISQYFLEDIFVISLVLPDTRQFNFATFTFMLHKPIAEGYFRDFLIFAISCSLAKFPKIKTSRKFLLIQYYKVIKYFPCTLTFQSKCSDMTHGIFYSGHHKWDFQVHTQSTPSWFIIM